VLAAFTGTGFRGNSRHNRDGIGRVHLPNIFKTMKMIIAPPNPPPQSR
jgi:hypothetical protein